MADDRTHDEGVMCGCQEVGIPATHIVPPLTQLLNDQYVKTAKRVLEGTFGSTPRHEEIRAVCRAVDVLVQENELLHFQLKRSKSCTDKKEKT